MSANRFQLKWLSAAQTTLLSLQANQEDVDVTGRSFSLLIVGQSAEKSRIVDFVGEFGGEGVAPEKRRPIVELGYVGADRGACK